MTRRSARIATLFLFVAATCLVGPTPVAAADHVLVGAGDISDCGTAQDEETATLLDGLPGTIATFGDNAYPIWQRRRLQRLLRPDVGPAQGADAPVRGQPRIRDVRRVRLLRVLRDGRRPGREGLVQLRPRALARDRAELELQSGRMRAGLGAGQVAAGRPGRPRRRSRHRVLASPALQLRACTARTTTCRRSGTPCTPRAPTSSSTATTTTTSASHHRPRPVEPIPPTGSASSSSGRVAASSGPVTLNAANSEVFSSTFGVLKLTLHADSYDWQFIPIAGESFTDSGTDTPHGPPTMALKPTADAWVDQRHPRTNHGKSSRLYVDGDAGRGQDLRSYVKFKVAALAGTVDRAVLRLWVTNGTSNGPTVAPTSTSWSAGTLTWRNRPGRDRAGRRRCRSPRRRPVGRVRRDRAGARQRHLRVPASLDFGRRARRVVGERRAPPASGPPIRRPLRGPSYRVTGAPRALSCRGMAESWVCGDCRSFNQPKADRCYRCHVPRKTSEMTEANAALTTSAKQEARTLAAQIERIGARYVATWPLALAPHPADRDRDGHERAPDRRRDRPGHAGRTGDREPGPHPGSRCA